MLTKATIHPAVVLLAIGSATTQGSPRPATPPLMVLESKVDSGYLANPASQPRVVFTRRLHFDQTAWLQFRFGQHSNLPAGSFLRLTAKKDGERQRHDGRTIDEWSRQSALFNGDEVLLELVAGPRTRGNRVKIDVVTRGLLTPATATDSICGARDKRVRSNDKRQGRIDGGCTGWLAGKIARGARDLMLTAGHCRPPNGIGVLALNVPLSNANGSINRAAVNDQYPYRVLAGLDTGKGSDWAVCSVGKNSNTGKTPTDANGGVWYKLGPVPGSTAGQNITVTGYGSVTAPVSLTLSQVQKTHTGPLATIAATSLCYATDTTKGDSGAPIIHSSSGNVIGIHTHAGCNPTGGCNSGTRIDRSDLRAAIAAAGKVAGTFVTFGVGCRGTGTVSMSLCGGNNPGGGTLTGSAPMNEYAYEATATTALRVTGFALFASSNSGRVETIRTAIYADVSGAPATKPLATGTMKVGLKPGFYTTTLNASIPKGRFYIAADHTGGTTNLADLTSGNPGRAFFRTVPMGTAAFRLSGIVARSSFRVFCRGGNNAVPVIGNSGIPNINSSFRVTLAQARANAPATLMTGDSRTRWAGLNLPFPLSVIGAAGCSLLVSPVILIGARTDANGNGSILFKIPNIPALIGNQAYHQWYVAEPTVNSLGLSISNGGRTTAGG